MKTRLPLGLLVLALTAACQHQPVETPKPAEDPDWITLEIPGEREANAVAGSIDGTLLVTTYTHAYISTDQGRTWQQTKNFNGPVQGLAARHDTLVALGGSGGDLYDRFASIGTLFTPDFGRTWLNSSATNDPLGTFLRLQQPIGKVQVANGPAYRIKFNYTPDAPGSSSYYSEPSDLLKTEAGSTTTLRPPAQKLFRNLHLDGQNRLYIAAASCAHRTAATDCRECQPGSGMQSSALIYVSRKPLP